ncbi:hydrolytic protein [Streptomyces sp. B6B3]|uniref:COG1470 family protein n=1 Tax=Streptomyces sp. B6B3 TaxID=3153570 RepID=UPI00325C8B2E
MSTTAHVASPSVSVAPGDEQHVVLHVRNGGDIVESYQLTVVGDGSDWISVEPERLSLYPGTEGSATLAIRPPRSSAVRAGDVPYGVRVLPTERPGEVVVPEGRVEVLPFHELDAEVLPPERRRRLRARFQARVANRGNTPVTVSLAVEATSEEVRHTLSSETLTLEPGEETYVDLTVRPQKLLWFGTGVQHPFAVRVRRDGEEDTVVPLAPNGTYVQMPLLPRWLLALLALLLALIALWYALALPAVRSAAREQADEAIEESTEDTTDPTQDASGGAGDTGGEGTGAGGEEGSAGAGGEEQGDDGTGAGSGSGGTGGGEEFATVLETSVAAGESETAVYEVADDELLLITDIVADAPQGDTGTLRVTINDHTVTSLALENFRSHDNHWVTPIEAPPGSTIEMSVTCRQPGSPPDAPAPSTCEESLFVTGTRVAVD